jgi:AraC family transcriptional regulator
LAKIAVEHAANGAGGPATRVFAAGDGWTIADVLCRAGPGDRPFEEQHSRASIAVVVSGTFQYRTSTGRALMTPGSLLLGNAGDCFTCGHEHGVGDRCVAFFYTSEFREQAGIDPDRRNFRTPRLPAVRPLSALVASASALLENPCEELFEETALQVFDRAIRWQNECESGPRVAEPSSLARVTRVVRMMEAGLALPHSLCSLAETARLSPYHFLRMFEALTGTTPRQYLLRSRLRRAAVELKARSDKIVEIALACGFGDISNFNKAFRAEFGKSPREYRRG